MRSLIHQPDRKLSGRTDNALFTARPGSSRRSGEPIDAVHNDFRWSDRSGKLPMVQMKSRVSVPGDPYERQADRIADRVVAGRGGASETIATVGGMLQRSCSCGGSGDCEECRKNKEGTIQRKTLDSAAPATESTLHSTVNGGGEPMNHDLRGFFEERMGMSFDNVRIHKGASAAESARSIDARAYTSGRDIVFGEGEYRPETDAGKRLIAHELVHVAQQGGVSRSMPYRSVDETSIDGGRRFAFGPSLQQEPPELEHQAESLASSALAGGLSGGERSTLRNNGARADLLQRYRIPLPTSVPLCGREVTHIDIESPRWRELEGGNCDNYIPRGTLVKRLNIVGRQVTPATTGNGRIVFNLHIGYYRHPVTGRYCAVVDDSRECLCPRCALHVCFLTPQEVLDAVWEFLKKALTVLGWIALAILLAAILAELVGLILAPAAVLADNGGPHGGEGTGPASPAHSDTIGVA